MADEKQTDEGKGAEAAAAAALEESKETTSDRVVVKPDGAGGYTVEKFGGSTYFTAVQWYNFQNALKEADEAQAEANKQAQADAEVQAQRESDAQAQQDQAAQGTVQKTSSRTR